jgi:CRP-like cAMP-binding protein
MATLLDHAQRLLAAHPTRGVDDQSLAAVFSSARIDRLQDGHVICTEGEPGEAIYFLMKGTIRVQRRDPRGRVRELATIPAPALLGHMALIDNSPRSATCIAVGETFVATLDRLTYNSVLGEPTTRGTALRRILLASLTRQLVGANARIRDLLRTPHLSDSAHATLEVKDEDQVEDFDVSQSDLMRVSGVLEGWKVDSRTMMTLQNMEVVYTEDQRRNPKNKSVH